MSTNTDKEYEERLQMIMEIFCQKVEAGQLNIIVPELRESIPRQVAEIKKTPDGKFIFESISSTILTLAKGFAEVNYREETKKICSLQEIQIAYFNYIENVFGDLYKDMQNHKMAPGNYAGAFAKANYQNQKLLSEIDQFLEENVDFWRNYGDVANVHVEELNCLKALFGGDLMPTHTSDIVSNCGLYVDTIILPEPFIQSRMLFSRWGDQDKMFYFIKHGLNLLKYKDAVLSDTDYPIAVVLPNSFMLFADQYQESRFLEADKNSIRFSAQLFGREFAEEAELLNFVGAIKTKSDLIENIKNKELLLLTEFNDPLEKQIAELISHRQNLQFDAAPLGKHVFLNTVSRMRQAAEIIARSQQFNAAPLIDAPTSWQYLQWSSQISNDFYTNSTGVLIPNALSRVRLDEMTWLGNLPVSTLVKARKSGFMEDLREMFKGEIGKLDGASSAHDLESIGMEVTKNINNAVKQHQDTLKKLDKEKMKTIFTDGSKAIISGIFNISSGLCTLPFSHSPIDAIIVGGAAQYGANLFTKNSPDINSVKKDLTMLSKKKKTLNSSAVGFLCSLKKNNQSK